MNFAGAVDSEATEANDLTVTTGSGNVTFTGVVGGVDALDALTVNSGGLTKFSAAVTAANVTTDAPGTVQVNGGTVTTTGAQTYNDALSLGDDTTLSGSAITTNGTVAGGSHSLDITGDAVFGDESGDTVTGLTTLSVSGTTGINTSNITSSGAQTYNDDVIVGADTTLTTTDSAVNFAGAVDSEATEANDLTVTTGSGNVTFTGVVGGVDALDALTVNSGGLTKFSAAVTAANVTTDAPGTVQVNGGTVTTTGAQTYNDALSLGDDTTLSGSAITTNGTVAGGSHSLDITGDAVFGDASGDTVTGLTTLSVSGTTGINTSNITSSGAQTYNDDVIVGADTTLTTTDSAVNFAGAVDSEATEANDLTVTTGNGNVTFTGVVGGVDALDALTVNSGGLTKFSAAVTAANVTTDAPGTVQVNGGTVTTTGAQTYNDALSLGDDTTLSGSAITTNGTVAGGSHSLDITGDAVFGDASGDTVTGLTTLSVSGTTGINTSNITSSGAQDYTGAVILGSDTTLTGVAVSFDSTVKSDGTNRSLTIDDSGTTTFGGAVGSATAGEKLSSLTTDASGTVALDGGTVYTTGTQTYNDAVILGADTTLNGVGITLDSTVKSDGTNRSLTINDSGTTTFGGAVGSATAGEKLSSLATDAGGATVINGGSVITTSTQTYGDNVTLGVDTTLSGSTITTNGTVAGGSHSLDITGNAVFGDASGDTVTGLTTLSVSGTTGINTSNITSSGTQTYADAVTIGENTNLTAGKVTFDTTVDSVADGDKTLTVTGDAIFTGAVGEGTTGSTTKGKLGSLHVTGTSAIDGGKITTTGTQTYDDALILGADTALTGSTVTTKGTVSGDATASLNITGNAVFGDAEADSVTGLTTLSVSGATTINTSEITTSGNQTYTGAVTLGADSDLTSGSAINFGGTVDSDAVTARSLRLTSATAAGQNFVAAVGGIHALNMLRIESAGVITQGGSAPIKAAKLAIKSSANVTLDNTGNDVDVLAALLSGNASLTFVDADGVEIGTIDSAALQIVGISDGTGTSNVSITLGGALTQAASSPILLDGNLTIDTTSYDADDVSLKNIATGGTTLDNSLIAGDFSLTSTGNVTQKADANGVGSDAWLKVGGSFDVNGTGTFIQGNSSDNLIGGGSAGSAPNEIRLYGVITLSMVGENLVASATTTGTGETSTDTILAADLTGGIAVTSDAGGKSISAVTNGAAITLNEANSVGGFVKITTKGIYSNSGSAVATGILQSTDLNLASASFFVQQSTANATSLITGAGKLDLSNPGNTFTGTVSATAIGMDVHLREDTALELGTINGKNVIVELDSATSALNITQATGATVRAETLLLRNAHDVTLSNANRVDTLAAILNGDLTFINNQSLTVGTASLVNGITTTNSNVVLQTTTGDLILGQAITVPGSANITLASAGNFINNVGPNALVIGTGSPGGYRGLASLVD